MKIGFDIHGVIDSNIDFFTQVINDLYDKGNEIHILTGALYKDVEHVLKNIKYDKFFSILQYHKDIGTKMWEDERGSWIDKDEWNKTKGDYCNRNNIDIHIDDSIEYSEYFEKNSFAHYTNDLLFLNSIPGTHFSINSKGDFNRFNFIINGEVYIRNEPGVYEELKKYFNDVDIEFFNRDILDIIVVDLYKNVLFYVSPSIYEYESKIYHGNIVPNIISYLRDINIKNVINE
jgi:hypothetical protein